jgi:hypothetical protein
MEPGASLIGLSLGVPTMIPYRKALSKWFGQPIQQGAERHDALIDKSLEAAMPFMAKPCD